MFKFRFIKYQLCSPSKLQQAGFQTVRVHIFSSKFRETERNKIKLMIDFIHACRFSIKYFLRTLDLASNYSSLRWKHPSGQRVEATLEPPFQALPKLPISAPRYEYSPPNYQPVGLPRPHSSYTFKGVVISTVQPQQATFRLIKKRKKSVGLQSGQEGGYGVRGRNPISTKHKLKKLKQCFEAGYQVHIYCWVNRAYPTFDDGESWVPVRKLENGKDVNVRNAKFPTIVILWRIMKRGYHVLLAVIQHKTVAFIFDEWWMIIIHTVVNTAPLSASQSTLPGK